MIAFCEYFFCRLFFFFFFSRIFYVFFFFLPSLLSTPLTPTHTCSVCYFLIFLRYATDESKAGALLAIGVVNSGTRDESETAFGLLPEYTNEEKSTNSEADRAAVISCLINILLFMLLLSSLC